MRFLLFSFVCLLFSLNIFSQTKTIANQEITPSSGVYFEALMNTSQITVTIQGPADRWFAVAFGLGMADGDALIYTDGKVGAMHALGVWDYDLNAQNAAGVDKDAQDNWSVSSNTTNLGVRTIVASRNLNTGDPIDHIINFGDASLDLIWAKGNTASNTLAYHGGNRGSASIMWTIPDLTPPQLSVTPFFPADNSIDVALGTNGIITFDENIALGAGMIELHLLSGGALVEQFDVATSSNLSISSNQLTLNPSLNLASFTDYYITVESGAITDLAGNSFVGFINNSTWNFTTIDISGDVTPPSLSIGPFSPADNAVSVPLNTNMTVLFDEDIQFGIGLITLLRLSDDLLIESFDVATSSNLTLNGAELTINPTSDLLVNTEYYITIDQGALEDLSGNGYAGFNDNSTWNFATLLAGIEELDISFSIELLPNNFISIVNHTNGDFYLKIINLFGQLLFEQSSSLSNQIINTEKFKDMTLIISVTNKKDQTTKLIRF